MTSVQLKQIDHAFGGKRVLDGLDLNIDSGRYVVLLGPSGCGKTTTLRILAGLITADRGEVRFGGQRVDQIAPRDRDVAMVFQQDGLYPHLTIAGSIRCALRGKIDEREIKARVDEAVGLTGIESILDRYPGRLSGGELRRAALAKAIARHSTVRLLDEPLSALDVPVRHALQDDILRWHGTVAGTTIHVTHDGQEAMRMADKIAVMDKGKIVQFASPADIFTRPASVAVAKAIGSPPIQLFRARIKNRVVQASDSKVSIRMACDRSDQDVIAGVRPDALRVVAGDVAADQSAGDDAAGDNAAAGGLSMRAEVIRFQHVGRDIHVHGQVGDETVIATVSASMLDQPLAGTIRLVADPRNIHLFAGPDGRRVNVDSADG